MQAILEHDWMREWIAAAEAEEWVIEQWEAVR
jgi:glutathione S-transferase